MEGGLTHDEQLLALVVVQLKHVAGKLMHLRKRDGHHFLSTSLEAFHQLLALSSVFHGVETHNGKVCAHMHHDIRVIDRHTRFVLAMKDEEVVAQLVSPVGQHVGIGARRQTSKSNAMLAVENE